MLKLSIAILSGMLVTAPVAGTPHCAPVTLSVAGSGRQLANGFGAKSRGFAQTSANFAKAYAHACVEGLLSKKPLIDRAAKDKRHLFLSNAPEANELSIYLDGRRMVLEYRFVSGGATEVPGVGDLHEAIYCAVHGASEKERDESGRCLSD